MRSCERARALHRGRDDAGASPAHRSWRFPMFDPREFPGAIERSIRRVRALLVLAAIAASHGSASARAVGDPEASSATGCTPAATAKRGQQRIDQGRYEDAIADFACVIQADPLG